MRIEHTGHSGRAGQEQRGPLRSFGLIETFLALTSIPFLNQQSREEKGITSSNAALA
jgi:hypothetical protein